MQSFGKNYLLPVDASLADAADLDFVALEAASVLRQMASARNRTNIVIFDACRNNPFEEIAALNDNGLAEMKAPRGTYLAYATEPGGVALDGLDGNSPFTSGPPEIAGKTIAEVVALSPLFSPIEGIPDELWKGQRCSNCHQWTRDALCTQANSYLTENAARSLAKEHPFGGPFKGSLRNWAQGGCP